MPVASDDSSPFGNGGTTKAKGMLSPALRRGHPWNFDVATSRSIYGFDALDTRSRSFNMIRASLIELKAERGWRLIGVVSATPKVGKSFIAPNIPARCTRRPCTR